MRRELIRADLTMLRMRHPAVEPRRFCHTVEQDLMCRRGQRGGSICETYRAQGARQRKIEGNEMDVLDPGCDLEP